jgi:hypothetical protein
VADPADDIIIRYCPVAPILGTAIPAATPYLTSNPVVADFNRDGNLDVAFTVTNYPTQELELAFGNGAGGWASAIILASDALITDTLTGDFNRDGIPDLVYRNASSQLVTLLLDANATVKTTYSSYFGGVALKLVDLDGDGWQDVVGYYDSAPAIDVAFGIPSGNFASARTVNWSLPRGSSEDNLIAVGDVNRDGQPDLALINYLGVATFYSWESSSSSFTSASFSTGINLVPYAPTGRLLALADVNGDAKLDLVSSEWDAQNVYVFLGNGDFTFQAAKVMAVQNITSNGFVDVHIADVNHDGRLDLVVDPSTATQVDVYTGNGDGTFAAVQSFDNSGHANGIPVFGDFNRDGRMDMVLAGSGFAQIFFVPGNY